MRTYFRKTDSTKTPTIGLSVFAVALLGMTAMPALAQMPPGRTAATGARPGHQIGVAVRCRSPAKRAIGSADTRSTIAPTLPASTTGNDWTSR